MRCKRKKETHALQMRATRKRLKKQVAELQQKLDRASVALDSLERLNFKIVSDQLDFIREDQQRDQEITELTSEQLSIWKSLSRGLSFTTNINSQVYNFTDAAASSPVSVSARLGINGDRWSLGVVPFTAALTFPTGDLQMISGVKLSLGYKWF